MPKTIRKPKNIRKPRTIRKLKTIKKSKTIQKPTKRNDTNFAAGNIRRSIITTLTMHIRDKQIKKQVKETLEKAVPNLLERQFDFLDRFLKNFAPQEQLFIHQSLWIIASKVGSVSLNPKRRKQSSKRKKQRKSIAARVKIAILNWATKNKISKTNSERQSQIFQDKIKQNIVENRQLYKQANVKVYQQCLKEHQQISEEDYYTYTFYSDHQRITSKKIDEHKQKQVANIISQSYKLASQPRKNQLKRKANVDTNYITEQHTDSREKQFNINTILQQNKQPDPFYSFQCPSPAPKIQKDDYCHPSLRLNQQFFDKRPSINRKDQNPYGILPFLEKDDDDDVHGHVSFNYRYSRNTVYRNISSNDQAQNSFL